MTLTSSASALATFKTALARIVRAASIWLGHRQHVARFGARFVEGLCHPLKRLGVQAREAWEIVSSLSYLLAIRRFGSSGRSVVSGATTGASGRGRE